jgi:amino acid permease
MHDASRDEQDLARFGYKQELKRSLGVFSSFAVAFAYISPSTGIFALFALGLTTVGGVFIWSWPIVAIGQLLVAFGFAELSSHYPVAGSVFQWTKYLAGKAYAWFTGWIYLFAGVLTVASVCATLPFALIPAFNNMGWNLANNHSNQRWIAVITLVAITVMNIFGVRLVAIVNNTGVLFEILGMVVFAFIVALFHHHQSAGVIFHTGGTSLTTGTFLVAMFMSLYVIYGDKGPATCGAKGRDRIGDRRLCGRRHLPLRDAARDPEHEDRDQGRLGPGADHRREFRQCVLHGVPAHCGGGDLRLLPRDHDLDDPPVLRDGS